MIGFDQWAEEYRILGLADKTRKDDDEEIVLLSQVISHTCNIGYEMQRNVRLMSFNGVSVQNLRHLGELISSSAQKLEANNTDGSTLPFVFEFSGGQVIVLDGYASIRAQNQVINSSRYLNVFIYNLS